MSLGKTIERFLFPCQKKIDCIMSENQDAWRQFNETVKEKKDAIITAYPQFQHVVGKPHVNPR